MPGTARRSSSRTRAGSWNASPPRRARAPSVGPIRTTPIALFPREHADAWRSLAWRDRAPAVGPNFSSADFRSTDSDRALSSDARDILAVLERLGASFFAELVSAARLLPTLVERALAELVGAGLVTADGFAGLRALLTPSDRRKPLGAAGMGIRRTKGQDGVETAGRWSLLRFPSSSAGPNFSSAAGATEVAPYDPAGSPKGLRYDYDRDDAVVEIQAQALLRRYGIVFRRLLARESRLAPWRDLTRVYRRLEARGEIRGGRFVAGMSGEQFALPEAVAGLRAVRKKAPDGALIGISAVDPLNLAGVVTTGEVVPALAANRLAYRNGVPLAAREGGRTRPLTEHDAALDRSVEQALVRRRMSEALKARLHTMGAFPR